MVKNIMLDLDISFLVIFFLVWVLMVVMDRIFFTPIGGMIQKRENLIAAESGKLQSINNEIESGTLRLESSLQRARQESVHIREELISSGESVRDRMIDDARSHSREIMDREMKRLEEEILIAEKKLESRSREFSEKISEIFT